MKNANEVKKDVTTVPRTQKTVPLCCAKSSSAVQNARTSALLSKMTYNYTTPQESP